MPLTETQRLHGPFAIPAPAFWPGGPKVLYICGVQDRITMVKKSTDADWLGYVVTHAEQKTVRVAAARRLKWVNKAVSGLIADYKKRNP